MEQQNSTPFRQESLKRISSPEQLTDYLKVTNPGIWIVLVAVIILLIGLFVWSTVGNLETVASGIAEVKDGTAVVYVTDSGKGVIAKGMPVRFEDNEFTISSVETDQYGRITATAPVTVADGSYEVKVVMDSITPISFLLENR